MSTVTENIKEGVASAAQTVADKTNQIGEKAQEKKADAKYQVHKNQAHDPDQPLGDRVKAGLNAAGDKIEGAKHETKGEYYKQKPDDSYPKSGGIVEDIKEGVSSAAQAVSNTVSQVGESLMGTKAEAEYEMHQNQVLDSNMPTGDRAKAGAKAAEDQIAQAKYGDFFTEKPLDDGSTSTVITGIKDTASNTLNYIGETVQGTAEYIKGEEPVGKTEEGVVQSIKDGAAATLQSVGESTQQTAEYIRGKQTPTEKALHSVFKEVDQVHDEENTKPVEPTGDQAKAGAERVKAEQAEAEYDAHWAKVDDPSQPMTTRVVAALQCVGDTLEGYQHRANEQYWKQNK